MELAEIQSLYDAGNTEMVATLANGEKMNLRLFMSTSNILAYFAKGKSRKGYPVWNIVKDIVSVKVKAKKNQAEPVEKYLDNLKKFKEIFTQKCHKNLWESLQKGYADFDVQKFEAYLKTQDTSDGFFYTHLVNFCKGNTLYILTENNYKVTTIRSNAPKCYNYSYEDCIANVGKQIENKENFSYHWESNYDVSVEGKVCDDGIYRGWLSLEYRGCGNGHYYLLINDNQAVFSEDD